jgi:predicted secreted protein
MNKIKAFAQNHTHLQAAQTCRTEQSLQKSVLFFNPIKLKNKKFLPF